MKVYLVGGACRDILMHVTPKDHDYVVVGSSPDEMLGLGFKQVGKEFPVFLHPVTGDEYALARTDSKVGHGHAGFVSEWDGVSLMEDLIRRDLTINAIAIEVDYDETVHTGSPVLVGEEIDLFGGMLDIQRRIIRHTAASFSEDPLRVLRVARFLARFGKSWQIAEETRELMRDIYCDGELLSLAPERVWLETEKALGEKYPSLYFETLKEFNHLFIEINNGRMAMQKLEHHPERDVFTHQSLVVDYAAKAFGNKLVNFACMMHDLGKYPCWIERGNAFGHDLEGLSVIHRFCDKWRVPNTYRHLALLVCRYHTVIHGCMGINTSNWMRPSKIVGMFESSGALRNPSLFEKVLMCCEADARGRGSNAAEIHEYENTPYPQREYLLECLSAVIGLDTKVISSKMLAENKPGPAIGQAITQERINLVRSVQAKWMQA